MKRTVVALVLAGLSVPVVTQGCTSDSGGTGASPDASTTTIVVSGNDGAPPSSNCLVNSACCVLAQQNGEANPLQGSANCTGDDLGGKAWCGAAAELLKKALNATEVDGDCVLGLSPGTVTRVPIVWVNSTNENKIALYDSSSGAELLRVPTYGHFPNRTAVAADGSVWITNRDSYQYIHIGLDGKPICASEYGGSQPAGPTKVGYTRAAAIDSEGNAWIGFNDTGELVKLDPKASDGTVTVMDDASATSMSVPKCKETKRIQLATTKPYGIAADGDGNIWVGILGSGTVAKVNATAGTIVGEYNLGTDPKVVAAGGCTSFYGMAIDADGNPWFANYGCGNIVKVDKTNGSVLGVFKLPADAPWSPRAMGIDRNGHMWVADNGSTNTHEFLPDGTHVKQVDVSCADHPGGGTLGTGTDIDGNVWTVLQNAGYVSKYKTDGTKIGCYPTAPVAALASPYTYSDLTGSTNSLVTSQLGRFRAIVERPSPIQWALVSDKQVMPAGTTVCVRVRAADDRAALEKASWSSPLCTWTNVGAYSVVSLADGAGKFIVPKSNLLEVELQLNSADKSVTPTVSNLSVAGIK